jgi:hypothetical protein
MTDKPTRETGPTYRYGDTVLISGGYMGEVDLIWQHFRRSTDSAFLEPLYHYAIRNVRPVVPGQPPPFESAPAGMSPLLYRWEWEIHAA